METTKPTEMETPARQINVAKEACQQKLVEAISEFERVTGLWVDGIEYKRCQTKINVTIAISL